MKLLNSVKDGGVYEQTVWESSQSTMVIVSEGLNRNQLRE